MEYYKIEHWKLWHKYFVINWIKLSLWHERSSDWLWEEFSDFKYDKVVKLESENVSKIYDIKRIRYIKEYEESKRSLFYGLR